MIIWLRNSNFSYVEVARLEEPVHVLDFRQSFLRKLILFTRLIRDWKGLLRRGSNRGPLGRKFFTKRTLYHRASRPRLSWLFIITQICKQSGKFLEEISSVPKQRTKNKRLWLVLTGDWTQDLSVLRLLPCHLSHHTLALTIPNMFYYEEAF